MDRGILTSLWFIVVALSLPGCGRVPDHTAPAIQGTSCFSCHGDLYLSLTDPNHVTAGFSQACETCHTTDAWRPAAVGDHGFWPLTGAHQTASCESCHADGHFNATPRECVGCHQADFTATTNPDHVARGFGTTCETCHTTAAWHPASFDHDALWPLVGAHATVACESCHAGGVYANTPRSCEGCHLAAFQASTQPNHVALGLSTACESCHSVAAWRPASFTVHDQYWPLVAKHTAVACTACHIDGVFTGTARACEGCHMANYAATTQPDHEALAIPTACGACHTEAGWRPADFNAHDQFWPIEGKHLAVACESCHANSVFTGTPRACEGCHMADYTATTDPDHAALGLSTACGGCHTAADWKPAGFTAHDQFWPIEGQHKDVACESCHVDGQFAGTPRACEGCHMVDFQATRNPDHVAANLPTECGGCHTAAGWSPAGFAAHDQFWPLEGKHEAAACESCHANSVFAGTARTCNGCHLPDYQATQDPPHAAAGFPKTCETCHDAFAWAPSTFDHDTYWPLAGKHQAVACESCHAGGTYAGTERTCEGCHLADYQTTTDPNHAALQFPTACGGCHTASGWSPAGFTAHDQFWPLQGRHATATCESCHAGGVFAGTPRTCEGCHLADYQTTTAPDHAAAGYPKTCETCHSAAAWAPAAFDHGRFWPLTGKHAAAACDGCHAGGVFAGTPKVCESCHLADYQASTRPAHAAAGYPKACETCHSTAGWAPSSFDHARSWPLAGKHASTTCVACHAGDVFAGTTRNCDGCHHDDFLATRTPPHQAAGFSTSCETCHTATGWTPAAFDHARFWPLTGAHRTATCESCHVGNVFAGTTKACDGCHLADYQATREPPHAVNGYPRTCESCHTTAAWTPAAFDHARFWPLAGKHATTTCESCHVGGVFAGTPRTCEGCHYNDFLGTDAPPHAAAGFSTSCETCHTAAAWTPSSFNHNSVWLLAGRHATAPCESCHVNNVYAGTARTCDGCHLSAYQATTAPSHVAAGFPRTCETCHSASAWTPSTFNHNAFWPLAGKHAAATCESCHIGGVFAGTPRACVACHRPEYQATNNPPHAAAGFPTTCETCHTSTTAWTPATFNHNAFWPLSGKHATATCETCHVGGVFAGTPRTCEGCHLPEYHATTSPTHAAAGFPTTCETCHTSTTAWTPATFNHNAFWPLTGHHATTTCESCHVGGVYAGTPRTCQGCHLPEYQATTSPAHAAAGFPKTCETCHTSTTAWTPATFNHSQFWPLTGQHTATPCESCHAGGVYAGTPTTCVGCHRPDYNASTNPSHVTLNLPTTCETCHTTNNWDTTTFPGHNALFPITTGKHRNFQCQDCHKAPEDWGEFTCTGCHTGEHALARMNNKHSDVGNYQATLNNLGIEPACLHCHPTGQSN